MSFTARHKCKLLLANTSFAANPGAVVLSLENRIERLVTQTGQIALEQWRSKTPTAQCVRFDLDLSWTVLWTRVMPLSMWFSCTELPRAAARLCKWFCASRSFSIHFFTCLNNHKGCIYCNHWLHVLFFFVFAVDVLNFLYQIKRLQLRVSLSFILFSR